MNTKILKLFLALATALAFTACIGHYADINRNPYETDKDEQSRDGYDISASMRAMQYAVIPTDVNRCHQTDILLGGAYGRYTSESKANTWQNKFSTFDAPDNWSNVMFNEIIPNIYPSYTKLHELTDDEVVLAVADIIRVIAMHRVTDAYGPIPYSKIGKDGAIQVPYDSQQDIYNAMFDELDAAIETLTEMQTLSISVNADIIYKGDLVKWVKLANSLKLRLAMRIVYADEAKAKQMAEEAVAHSIGVMTSNADNAFLTSFGNTEGNPISASVKYNDGDNRSIADMTAYMNAYSDPRMAAYFEISGFTADKGYTAAEVEAYKYTGYRSGINMGSVPQFQNYSLLKIDRDTPLQWMNVAEVMFLKAEGALRGWSMGGTAGELYSQGVNLSFEQWGVGGAAAYLTGTSIPTGYNDPQGTYSYNNVLTDISVNWVDETDFERGLERIMIQKWLANFLLGQEAWADRRRTGYPKMLPIVVNNSPGGILANNETPRRLPYPSNESLTNTKNYYDAVTMLGGADNLATKVWWDKK